MESSIGFSKHFRYLIARAYTFNWDLKIASSSERGHLLYYPMNFSKFYWECQLYKRTFQKVKFLNFRLGLK